MQRHRGEAEGQAPPCWVAVTLSSSFGPWQECVVFCVREEPVLFLRADDDFVPYTPRDKQNLRENLQGLGPGIQAESLELAIRKEVRVPGVGGGPSPWQAVGICVGTLPPSPTVLSPAHAHPLFSPGWASRWL